MLATLITSLFTFHKRVYVQPFTAAGNATLLALAADRRAAVHRRLLQQSISIACPLGHDSKPAARCCSGS